MIPDLDVQDLCFFSTQLDLGISSLRAAAQQGSPCSIEEIAEKYLDPLGLDPTAHAAGLAILLATAMVRLVGLGEVSVVSA